MSKYVLNETPIRTSRNFNINSITIKDFEVPNSFNEFKNVTYTTGLNLKNSKDLPIFKYSLGIENYVLYNLNKNILLTIDKDVDGSVIDFNFDEENVNLASLVKIVVKENVKASIILRFDSKIDKKFFASIFANIVLERGAYLSITIINFLNDKSDFLELLECTLLENAEIDIKKVNLGAKNRVSNIYVNLLEEGSKSNISEIYIGKNEEIIDLNYICDLVGKKSLSNIDVEGALLDNATKHFKGTLDFKKGAVNAKGNEEEFCYLLSDKAKSVALPILLCSEEDVEGNHASASGKVDEKQLFYLMSRGFSYKDALKIIVKAKFNIVLSQMDENVKDEIIERIDNILD